jgi:hypothetical protein
MRKDLPAARHRLSSFLIRHGRIYSVGSKWTQRHWVWLRAQQFERDCERLTVEHYMLEVEHLVERRDLLEREIARAAETEPYAP